MLLAEFMRDYPCELRADLQQTYGLNIDGMGTDYTTLHAADIVAMLPRGARVWGARNPDSKWTDELLFLNAIEFRLRALEWSLSGGKGKKPKPIHQSSPRQREGVVMDVDKMAEYLSLPREG